jgi:regulator of Ty1 transposition protein 103
MSLLNRDVLTSKLKSLDATQQSIEKITSWVLFYTREARTVVQVWLEELIRLPPDKKLAHLYLANHILQVL